MSDNPESDARCSKGLRWYDQRSTVPDSISSRPSSRQFGWLVFSKVFRTILHKDPQSETTTPSHSCQVNVLSRENGLIRKRLEIGFEW